MKWTINSFGGILLETSCGNIAVNGGGTISDMEYAYVMNGKVFANRGWNLSSKSEGVKPPSKSEKLGGFPDFRERRGVRGSLTALRKVGLSSFFGGGKACQKWRLANERPQ